MFPSNDKVVNNLIKDLLAQIKESLDDKLVGVYLTGSLVWGDFDENISDIDLVTALSSKVNDDEFEKLKKMHEDFVRTHQDWKDRIEVCYITVEALQKAKTETTELMHTSPGEPFHRRESSREWLMNWYLVREKGIVLFGPDPKTIIVPINKEEFIETVKTHARHWVDYVKDTKRFRASQAYAILTLCRALYAIKNGEQVSKKKAANWAVGEFPDWSHLIKNALIWREKYREKADGAETYPETVRFVDFVISKIS